MECNWDNISSFCRDFCSAKKIDEVDQKKRTTDEKMKNMFQHERYQEETRRNTLPATNMAPENGWLEYQFPFGARPISTGKLLVLGSVI